MKAEDQAWIKYRKIINCKGHELERRGYKNGAGFCKHCNLFVCGAFEPSYTPEEIAEHERFAKDVLTALGGNQ